MLAQAGVVDAGGRGLCVVLDAAESAITGQRAATATTPHVGSPALPVAAGPDRRPDRGRPGVRGDVPPRGRRRRHPAAARGRWPRSATRWSSWAARASGTSTSTSTTSVPRSRPASGPGRPRRIQVTHFAEQVAARAGEARRERRGRKLVVVAAGPGLVELFGEAGAAGHRGRPRPPARAPARSSRRSRPPARQEVDRAAQRPRLDRRGRGGGARGRGRAASTSW